VANGDLLLGAKNRLQKVYLQVVPAKQQQVPGKASMGVAQRAASSLQQIDA